MGLLLRVQTVFVLVCAAGCLSRPAGHGPGDGGGSGGEGSTGGSIGLVQAASMAGSLSTTTDVTLTTQPVRSHFLIVADSYDAMRSDRAYRPGLSEEAARWHMHQARSKLIKRFTDDKKT